MENVSLDRPQRPYAAVYELIKRALRSEAVDAELVVAVGPLARQFSTSRSPVERAVRMLAEEGLLLPAGNGRYLRPPLQPVDAGRPPVDLGDVIEALPGKVRDRARQASWQRIYDAVEKELVSYMPFGTFRLKESALADHLGVSRTVSSSLLSRLEERGVISRSATGRWQIAQLSQDELASIFQLRRLLEPQALLESAPLLPPDFLRQAMARVVAALDHPSEIPPEDSQRIEEDLHGTCLSRCRNARMLRVVRQSQILHVATTYLPNQGASLEERLSYLREHRMVLECIVAGSHGLAAHAMSDHLGASLERAALRLERAARCAPPELVGYLTPVSD